MGQIKNIKLHIVTDIKASNCHSRPLKMATQISKKRKFVADGVFKAELNEFLKRELAEDGYSGVEVRVTPLRTEIIILATRNRGALCRKGLLPRFACYCSVRVSSIQTSRWSTCSKSMLRRCAFHHGEWCQRLRSCCLW